MAHFPFHIGGAPLVHGSTAGIDQSGQRGRRVYIDPARGRAHITEIRAALPGQTTSVSTSAASVHGLGCAIFSQGSNEWNVCMALGGVFFPGSEDDTIPGGGYGLVDPDCPIPLIRDVDGQCRQPGSPADIDVGGSMGGAAVMGRHGTALAPDSEMRLHRDCLPGMVLGDDNLCYNRGSIRNSDRKYPRGARALGTPGEMAALRKAASFGRRMETTVKRMQKIGVLKKPASRKAAPKPKQLISGPAITAVSVGE